MKKSSENYKIKTQLIAKPKKTYKKKIVKKKTFKKKILKPKLAKKIQKKKISLPKNTNGKSFSKRLKKFYNPGLQGAEEVTFD